MDELLCHWGDGQPAVARWVQERPGEPGGWSRLLCREDLDTWLDIADDDPQTEPAALEWL